MAARANSHHIDVGEIVERLGGLCLQHPVHVDGGRDAVVREGQIVHRVGLDNRSRLQGRAAATPVALAREEEGCAVVQVQVAITPRRRTVAHQPLTCTTLSAQTECFRFFFREEGHAGQLEPPGPKPLALEGPRYCSASGLA